MTKIVAILVSLLTKKAKLSVSETDRSGGSHN
jgi:hypothetical protein